MPRMKVETSATPQTPQTKTIVEQPPAQPAQKPAPEPAAQPAAKETPTVRSKPALRVDSVPEQAEQPRKAAPAPKKAATQKRTAAPKKPAAQKKAAKPKVTADSVPADEQAKTALDRIVGAPHSAAGWVSRTFPGHEHAFYGACIALLLALLVFAIGPLKVFFVCLVVLIGIAIGQVFDGNPVIVQAIRDLFEGDRGQQ